MVGIKITELQVVFAVEVLLMVFAVYVLWALTERALQNMIVVALQILCEPFFGLHLGLFAFCQVTSHILNQRGLILLQVDSCFFSRSDLYLGLKIALVPCEDYLPR